MSNALRYSESSDGYENLEPRFNESPLPVRKEQAPLLPPRNPDSPARVPRKQHQPRVANDDSTDDEALRAVVQQVKAKTELKKRKKIEVLEFPAMKQKSKDLKSFTGDSFEDRRMNGSKMRRGGPNHTRDGQTMFETNL